MPIRVECEHCGRAFGVRESGAGKRYKCPGCGRVVTAPTLSTVARSQPPGQLPGKTGGTVRRAAPLDDEPPQTSTAPRRMTSPDRPSRRQAPPQVRPPADDAVTMDSTVSALTEDTIPDSQLPAIDPIRSASHSGNGAGQGRGAAARYSASGGRRANAGSGMPPWVLGVIGMLALAALAGGGGFVFLLMRDSGSGDPAPVAVANAASLRSQDSTAPHDAPPETNKKSINGGSLEHLTPKQMLESIVRVEVAGDSKQGLGTGFIIDKRGWVATNHHVIDQATKAEVVFEDGRRFDVEGVIAQERNWDLAILKMANPPAKLRVLDITFEEEPPLAMDVFAIGHPEDASFTLTKGVISRVLDTSDLPKEMIGFVHGHLQALGEFRWIQHDASIDHGSSGGPLLTLDGKVIGINTLGHKLSNFAVDVMYLEMMYKGNQDVQPKSLAEVWKNDKPNFGQPEQVGEGPAIPGDDGPGQIPEADRLLITPDLIKQQILAAESRNWTPAEPQHYEELQKLAQTLDKARRLIDDKNYSEEKRNALQAALDEALQKLKDLTKSATVEQQEAVNRFVMEYTFEKDQGVFAYAMVRGAGPSRQGKSVVVLEITGRPEPEAILLPVSQGAKQFTPGSHWLIVGIRRTGTQLRDPNSGKVVKGMIVNANHAFKVSG